jgi:hypothetical protein
MSYGIVSIQGNGVVHAPTCLTPATWPPPWLAESAGEPPAVALPPVAVVPGPEAPPVAVQPVGDGWDSAIEPPDPCPKCGSLELWQDFGGKWHCQHCEARKFQRGLQLAKRAERLRKAAPPADVAKGEQ